MGSNRPSGRFARCARCGATWSYPLAGERCPACSCERFSFLEDEFDGGDVLDADPAYRRLL